MWQRQHHGPDSCSDASCREAGHTCAMIVDRSAQAARLNPGRSTSLSRGFAMLSLLSDAFTASVLPQRNRRFSDDVQFDQRVQRTKGCPLPCNVQFSDPRRVSPPDTVLSVLNHIPTGRNHATTHATPHANDVQSIDSSSPGQYETAIPMRLPDTGASRGMKLCGSLFGLISSTHMLA